MGKLIVFEGIDGSGKSTQFDRLCNRLADESCSFMRLSFPRYDKPSSALVRMYLGGEFGDEPGTVNAYAASSFFAVDRMASYLCDWSRYYEEGGLILTDRYTTSNAIHQGAKLLSEERRSFFAWLYDYEFRLMGLPSPDLVIYMDIDANAAALRLQKRQLLTGAVGDIHENDLAYLALCAQCGKQAADYYGWRKVACFKQEHESTEDEIHAAIYDMLAAERLIHN